LRPIFCRHFFVKQWLLYNEYLANIPE